MGNCFSSPTPNSTSTVIVAPAAGTTQDGTPVANPLDPQPPRAHNETPVQPFEASSEARTASSAGTAGVASSPPSAVNPHSNNVGHHPFRSSGLVSVSADGSTTINRGGNKNEPQIRIPASSSTSGMGSGPATSIAAPLRPGPASSGWVMEDVELDTEEIEMGAGSATTPSAIKPSVAQNLSTNSASPPSSAGAAVAAAPVASSSSAPAPPAAPLKPGKLNIVIEGAVRLPKMDIVGLVDAYVIVSVNGAEKGRTSFIKDNITPRWNHLISLGVVDPKDIISFVVMDYDEGSMRDDFVGKTEMRVSDLIRRLRHCLMLFDNNHNIVYNKTTFLPSELNVMLAMDTFPNWPPPKPSFYPMEVYRKHIMMVTRGTRGDVQPFVALARGLAETYGFMITIVTEMAFRDFVKQNSQVKNGCIRFRPTGGDTAKNIDTPMAQWAVNSQSEVMQVLMMSRSEVEFFDSEPAIFYHAKVMRPDLLLYGLTMPNIALIVSEALNIPIIGFILQPTVIPSAQYPAIVPVNTRTIEVIDRFEEKFTSHSAHMFLRRIMENNPFVQNLSNLRQRRGLGPLKDDTWKVLLQKNYPVVVPIPETVFGGKPPDWSEHLKFTDFIFLRSQNENTGKDMLQQRFPDVMNFIQKARDAHAPVISMAFSSMPVPRADIMEIAVAICERCNPATVSGLSGSFTSSATSPSTTTVVMGANHRRPRVLVLGAPRDAADGALNKTLKAKIAALESEGRLYQQLGPIPYGAVFQLMDAAIVHGGLGTTAEVLRAGIPCLVSGVLLMDQRFWGQRANGLGVGPEPCHISKFRNVCVEHINTALAPNSEWARNAKTLSAKLLQDIASRSGGAGGGDADGVLINIQEVVKLAATPFTGNNMSASWSGQNLMNASVLSIGQSGSMPGPAAAGAAAHKAAW